ncbi:hypothetical protein AGR3A_Cc200006 [Agrobacterium tomkonis CFBP 6623]|uniref:Uncharacterized protein n=1 Tax=Agrobacterium tomkonis CFBP 6623 TaxID=1183432 RepID=A0A1S7P803_9HYPH|nr:hypothetical protein AGR3A_Cc200006 [Agrobacterium tomkonis CFBP 6623]
MPCHSACGEGALGASARDDEGDDKVADEADCEAGEKKDEQGFFHVSGSFHRFLSIEPVVLKFQRRSARPIVLRQASQLPSSLEIKACFNGGGEESLARIFRLFPASIDGGADEQRLVQRIAIFDRPIFDQRPGSCLRGFDARVFARRFKRDQDGFLPARVHRLSVLFVVPGSNRSGLNAQSVSVPVRCGQSSRPNSQSRMMRRSISSSERSGAIR